MGLLVYLSSPKKLGTPDLPPSFCFVDSRAQRLVFAAYIIPFAHQVVVLLCHSAQRSAYGVFWQSA